MLSEKEFSELCRISGFTVGDKKKFILPMWVEQLIYIFLVLLVFAGTFATIYVCYVVLQISHI